MEFVAAFHHHLRAFLSYVRLNVLFVGIGFPRIEDACALPFTMSQYSVQEYICACIRGPALRFLRYSSVFLNLIQCLLINFDGNLGAALGQDANTPLRWLQICIEILPLVNCIVTPDCSITDDGICHFSILGLCAALYELIALAF